MISTNQRSPSGVSPRSTSQAADASGPVLVVKPRCGVPSGYAERGTGGRGTGGRGTGRRVRVRERGRERLSVTARRLGRVRRSDKRDFVAQRMRALPHVACRLGERKRHALGGRMRHAALGQCNVGGFDCIVVQECGSERVVLQQWFGVR